MSDKRIVSIQLTKTKSVVAVEIGENKYADADGVTYKNIDSDFISDADDISEEEKNAFKFMSSLHDNITELEEQKRAIDVKKRAIDAKIAASKKDIKKAESVIRELQGRMSIADFAEAVGNMLPAGLYNEMVDKEFWCDTVIPGESVDENAIYILNVKNLRKCGLESLPFMYRDEYGDWEMYVNAEEYLKYHRMVDEYAESLSPSPENCKNTRNVPPALRIALEHLAKNHTARKKVEDKRTKFLKEIRQQLNELEKDECAIMKELRDAKGVISKNEFVEAFYEALPDRVKDAMKRYGYSAGSTPYNLGYDDNHIYIIRNVIVYKYNKNIPYAYEEYDGNWMMCDEAEEMEAYKKDIKKNEKLLPVSIPINSYMWTGDKFSTWYSGVYEIAIEDDMTKEYAEELAKKFAR